MQRSTGGVIFCGPAAKQQALAQREWPRAGCGGGDGRSNIRQLPGILTCTQVRVAQNHRQEKVNVHYKVYSWPRELAIIFIHSTLQSTLQQPLPAVCLNPRCRSRCFIRSQGSGRRKGSMRADRLSWSSTCATQPSSAHLPVRPVAITPSRSLFLTIVVPPVSKSSSMPIRSPSRQPVWVFASPYFSMHAASPRSGNPDHRCVPPNTDHRSTGTSSSCGEKAVPLHVFHLLPLFLVPTRPNHASHPVARGTHCELCEVLARPHHEPTRRGMPHITPPDPWRPSPHRPTLRQRQVRMRPREHWRQLHARQLVHQPEPAVVPA